MGSIAYVVGATHFPWVGAAIDPTRHYSCFDGLSSPQRAAGPFPDPAWLYHACSLSPRCGKDGPGFLGIKSPLPEKLSPGFGRGFLFSCQRQMIQ